jgi:hypothetical protein
MNNKKPTLMCRLGMHYTPSTLPRDARGPVAICLKCHKVINVSRPWFSQLDLIAIGLIIVIYLLLWIIAILHGWILI